MPLTTVRSSAPPRFPHAAPPSAPVAPARIARAEAARAAPNPLAAHAGTYTAARGVHFHPFLVVTLRENGDLRVEGRDKPSATERDALPFADTFAAIGQGPQRQVGRDFEGGHYDVTRTTTQETEGGVTTVRRVEDFLERGSILQPWRRHVVTTTLTFRGGEVRHEQEYAWMKRSFGFFGAWVPAEPVRGNAGGTIRDVTYTKT